MNQAPSSSLPAVLVALFGLSSLATSARLDSRESWPHLRGPDLDGSVELPASSGSPDAPAHLVFAPLWRRPLGSGYSAIVVAGGRGYTMATVEGRDRLLAFELDTGADLYSHDLGEVFRGRNGSNDGPLSTPTFADDMLYVLAPRGELSARRAADGDALWSRSLPDLGAPEPTYGFSTTPLVVDDLVVVATGAGDGAAVSAFDRTSGELRWQAGDGAVEVQIPTLATLGGRRQVISSTRTEMFGVEIPTGRVLWRHQFSEPRPWGLALAYPQLENRVLLTHDRGATLFQVERSASEGWVVRELWPTRDFRANGGNPRTPVLRNGLLFAHSDEFLTAISVVTGERVWRSRPPGGFNLIGLGGHLLVLGSEGELVAVRAGASGYQETGRAPAGLAHTVVTPASVAGDVVLVRDLREMAAFRVRPADRAPVEVPRRISSAESRRGSPTAPVGRVAQLLERLERLAGDAREGEIDRFMAEVGSLPIVEQGVAHFLARGSFEDLVITGDVTGLWELVPMTQVGDSDLYYAAFRLDGARRVRYRFLEFDEPHLDPYNPERVKEEGAEYSLWRDPGAAAPSLLATPPEPRLRSVSYRELPREGGRAPFGLTTSIPPGPAPPGGYPLAIVLRGEEAIDHGHWLDVLENLTRAGADRGVAVAFLHLPPAAWYLSNARQVSSIFVERFLPALAETPELSTDPNRRLVIGQGLAGASALHFAVAFEAWGRRVAVQSPHMSEAYRDEVWPSYDAADPLEVWIDWGARDGFDRGLGVDVAVDAQRLAERLRAAGHEVQAVESDGGHDWERWSALLPAILDHFF